MEIRNEINQILRDWKYEAVSTSEAIDSILHLFSVSNYISDEGLIELYRVAYNDGFDNISDKKDIIKHRQKQIEKIKKKYCS